MLCLLFIQLPAQQTYNLQSCLKYALENNHNLKKSQLDREKSIQAHREVLGSLMPQINGSAGLNDNIKKAKFIMPNFINSMLPPNAQDPNAPKYMTIEMGTNYAANFATTLNQQILNFSLFNAVDIAKTAENLAALGVESKEEDIITQTANLYYAIQATNYAIAQFDSSFVLIDKMIKTMEVSFANGLIKKVDLNRLKVNKVNMASQRSTIENAAEVQKNLLKLQMGLDMNQLIEVEKINIAFFENQSMVKSEFNFDLNSQIPYKLILQQENIVRLQRKAAVFESLPVLSLAFNYQYNGVSDEFFKGETNYWYPSSAIGLNLRVPIFAGFSRTAKIRQADIEQRKILEDASTLEQSLNMAWLNAVNKLDNSCKTIQAQHENMELAQEVYTVSENNFTQGLAPMSDVLNGSSSLIQSQVSYADALNNYMKAYIELLKANGTIRSLIEK
jgi:outer membrane protein TolC